MLKASGKILSAYFRRKKTKEESEKLSHHQENDEQSGIAVVNNAFLASNDSLEQEQNAEDSADGLDEQQRVNDDDRVEEQIEDKTAPLRDSAYGNVASK